METLSAIPKSWAGGEITFCCAIGGSYFKRKSVMSDEYSNIHELIDAELSELDSCDVFELIATNQDSNACVILASDSELYKELRYWLEANESERYGEVLERQRYTGYLSFFEAREAGQTQSYL